MLALPGSLLWLFLLVYFACGQILDITSLDNSNTSTKEFDDLTAGVNHTNIYNNEKEKNKTIQSGEEIPKLEPKDINQMNSLANDTYKTNPQTQPSQELNRTILSDSLGRSSKRRVTSPSGNRSRTTVLPMMSQERRNSYLSIAERRKYYNRTRVQTKNPQLNDVELEYQETTNKLVTSSTETLLVNEIRVIKQPINKDPTREVTTENNETNETNNQRILVNFPANETEGKPQTTRQSVIQSQYQFGQKLNLRKSVSRVQDIPEERLKRKKEKVKAESIMENSTNKLNKNYQTQSTKLVRLDKNLWATTTSPQADDDNENFVMNNGTVLEKLVDYITSNNTGAHSTKEAATSDLHNAENNQTKVPLTTSFNPLPLSNVNVTVETNLWKNTSAGKEISVIQEVYNQEILKFNNLTSTAATVRQSFVEYPIKNSFNYSTAVNNTRTHSTTEMLLGAFNSSATKNTTTPLNAPATAVKNVRFPSYQVTRPTILKSNFKGISQDGYRTTTPIVKAIYKDQLNSRPRFIQSEANVSAGLPKHVYPGETRERSKTTSTGPEIWSKTEEYPLTIELNENNKRVLGEMFQTLTTPKTRAIAKGEANTSQTKPHVTTKNESSVDNGITSTATTMEPASTPPHQQSGMNPVTATTNSTTTTTESPQVMPPDDNKDHKAQGTRYNTKFYISPKFNETKVIKVVEEDDENDEDLVAQGHSAGVAIYVLAAFGLVPLLLALIFGAKFMIQRNQREYECESDAKSEVSANENQTKENKKKKGSSDLKKSPSNVTTITLVTATRLPRVQHWENSEKQGNRNWEFPRSNLKLKTILGQGNFGQVWKAEAEDMPGHEGVTRLVAVKTVKEGATEKEHTEFIKELEIMQQIGSHPNIVTLLGCCTDQEPYYLIMEYVKHGKLLTYLREHRVNENYYNFSNNSDALTSRDLTVFAYCVARGMEYLASRGIIHRDLAARNVLVDHNKLCKIADFGMSRSVRDFENGQVYEERQQKGALPIRWMAPESLVYSVFTYKSDVWSFGIVMWEIVTLGSTPYPNMGAREVMRKVRDGYRLERPSHCKPELYRLISYCWAHDPNKRPDFSEIRHELGNLLDNPTKDGSYVDLDRFAVDNSFHVSSKTNDFRLLERNDFKTLQKLGDWENKDWPEDIKKIRMKRGRNNGKGTVTLTGQGSFTVNSRILEKEFKII